MNKNIKKIYQFIWKNKWVIINFDDPFMWKSERTSPIYIDLRKSFSCPEFTLLMIGELKKLVLKNTKPDYLLGIATAGISYAAIISYLLKIGHGYGKKEAKGYGKNKLIEGDLRTKKSVILIDDVCSTGSSLLKIYENLPDKSCVIAAFYTFYYQIPKAKINFEKIKTPLYYLLNVKDLLSYGAKNNFIDKETQKKVLNFVKNF